MSRWFRHYAGMMRDEKLVRVAVRSKQPVERVVWVWGAILESAAEINDGGRYEFDAGEAAYFLRCDEGELDAVLNELESAGRVVDGMVARWGDRQFSSDAGAERQRRYRDRKRGASLPDTGEDRNADRNGDARITSRDGEVTPQETDTETDISDAKASSKRAIEREFDDAFWPAYPLKVGKPKALQAFRAARQRASLETIMAGVARYAAAVIDAEKRFIKQPQGWLNRDGWDDEVVTSHSRATAPPRKADPVDDLAQFLELKRERERRSQDQGNHTVAELIPPDRGKQAAVAGHIRAAVVRPFD